MLIKIITPTLLSRMQLKFLYFIKNLGERRITLDAIKWLEQLSSSELQQPGTQIIIAIEQTGDTHAKLIGISGVSNYGNNIAFIVVHPHYRGKHIGQQLIRYHMETIGQYNCNVAMDNLSSLKMCFQAGLAAVELFAGVKDKPTLRMKGGNSLCLESPLEL